MSYYVEYNPELNTKYPKSLNIKSKMKLIRSIVWILILSGGFWLCQDELVDILIPGDNEVTISAVSSLVENVQSGEPVYESLMTFCDEIIVNAA